MIFWITAGIIILLVAWALISALQEEGESGLTPGASDIAVYRDQLAEVDRDVTRGALSQEEAEAVRLEVSRRLLDADKRVAEIQSAKDGRYWPAVLLIIAVAVGGTFALYSKIGAPGYADQPMKARIAALDAARATRPSQVQAETEAAPTLPKPPKPEASYLELVEQLRTAVSENPDGTRGYEFLFQHEAQLGNFGAARAAQEQLVALKGKDASLEERQTLLDAMVFSAGGYVSPEAESVLASLLKDHPDLAPAQYYQGLLYTQLGRPDLAFPVWRHLLEGSAPSAPWVTVIRSEIEEIAALAGVRYRLPELRGPSAEDIAAADEMSEEDRQAMIRGMVDGLADRLATEGGPVEDWARLIGALSVLGETDRARAIADEALGVFANTPDALAIINSAQAGLAK